MHIIQSKSNDIFRTLLSEISLAGAQRKKTLIIGDTLIQAWKDAQHHPGARRLKASQWIQLEGSVDHPLQSELSLSGLCLSDTCMRELTDMASPPNQGCRSLAHQGLCIGIGAVISEASVRAKKFEQEDH